MCLGIQLKESYNLAGVLVLFDYELRTKTNRYRRLVKFVSFVLRTCFAVAMTYFVRFALANLSAN